MEMTGFSSLLWWTLGGVALLVAGFFVLVELRAAQYRTRVVPVQGGLRFEANGFSVEALTSAREIKVSARRHAYYSRRSSAVAEPETQSGSVDASLPMPGLQVAVAKLSLKPAGGGAAQPTGMGRIQFSVDSQRLNQLLGRGGSQQTELRLDQVPDSVCADFQQFASGLRFNIEKVEQQLLAQAAQAQEALAARQAQEAAAAADAAWQAQGAPAQPGDPAAAAQGESDAQARARAQLDAWRACAGFSGGHTEWALDEQGQMKWLVDLDPDVGRIILRDKARTFYGKLKGATVILLENDLEVAVRDEFWTEDDPRLATFRVMAGEPLAKRQTWRQRIKAAIDGT
jgi:hypothetical protein